MHEITNLPLSKNYGYYISTLLIKILSSKFCTSWFGLISVVTFHTHLRFVILSFNLSNLHDMKTLKRRSTSIHLWSSILNNSHSIFICIIHTCKCVIHFHIPILLLFAKISKIGWLNIFIYFFYLQYSSPYHKLLCIQRASSSTIRCINQIHSSFAIISFIEFLNNQNHHLSILISITDYTIYIV